MYIKAFVFLCAGSRESIQCFSKKGTLQSWTNNWHFATGLVVFAVFVDAATQVLSGCYCCLCIAELLLGLLGGGFDAVSLMVEMA